MSEEIRWIILAVVVPSVGWLGREWLKMLREERAKSEASHQAYLAHLERRDAICEEERKEHAKFALEATAGMREIVQSIKHMHMDVMERIER